MRTFHTSIDIVTNKQENISDLTVLQMRRNISCWVDRVTIKRTSHMSVDIVTDKQENMSCESVHCNS